MWAVGVKSNAGSFWLPKKEPVGSWNFNSQLPSFWAVILTTAERLKKAGQLFQLPNVHGSCFDNYCQKKIRQFNFNCRVFLCSCIQLKFQLAQKKTGQLKFRLPNFWVLHKKKGRAVISTAECSRQLFCQLPSETKNFVAKKKTDGHLNFQLPSFLFWQLVKEKNGSYLNWRMYTAVVLTTTERKKTRCWKFNCQVFGQLFCQQTAEKKNRVVVF